MRQAILFLGTSLMGSLYAREAVESLGFRPIFLLKAEEYSGDPRQAIDKCEHYEADVNSLKDIQRVIKEHDLIKKENIVAVTSLLDETLGNACKIATHYGIAGPDPMLADLVNKAKVQAYIPEFSPSNLTFHYTVLTHKKLTEFLSLHNEFDEFVLKPGVSSGAVGAFVFNRSSITIEQMKQHIHDSKIDGALTHQSWVLQPRIIGRLHSLEGYVENGTVTFLGFSRRVRKALTECMNEFPVDKEISEQVRQQCQDAVTALVTRSQYKNGYFHCEFIITTDSAYFIDGNMGRIAGAAIVPQIALVYGKNLVDIYRHVFDLGVFQGQHTTGFSYGEPHDVLTASINYCLEIGGVVERTIFPDDLTCQHIQIANDGKLIPGVGESDSAWVGFLVGPRVKVLEEIKQLEIHTAAGPVPPFFVSTENIISNHNLLIVT